MRSIAVAAVVLTVSVLAGSADASTIVDRDARAVTLKVDGRGFAVVGYRAAGKVRHVGR